MLKDDRMMGMLTFVVIMLAVGTFIQRAEFFQRLMGTSGPAAELRPDVAEVRVGEAAAIDVLANDSGADDPAMLVIAAAPACGSAAARDGQIAYTATSECLGAQRLTYGYGTEGPTAELRISVRPPEKGEGKLQTVIRSGASETAASDPARETPADESRQQRAGEPAPGTELAAADASGTARQAGASAPGTGGDPGSESTASALAVNRAGSAGADEGTAPQAGSASPDASSGQPGQKCNFPPTLTVAARPAAVTEVAVDSPCDRDVVAVLAYDGLRFAIPLNFRGAGSLEVPGFQRSTEATLTLEEGGELNFNLPFEGIERIDRVAIAWEEPAALALNAFEFGARPGGQGHLTPEAPRSFEAVRREGGGWLASYAPEEGKGQRIDVYSFWRRHAGRSGVVKLALDPDAAAESGLCAGRRPGGRADGAAGGLDYVVLRATAGRLERSRLGRVAPLDCAVLAGGTRRYIENAVDDLIVRRR